MFHAFITINRPPALYPRGVFASAVFHFALLGLALGSRPAHVTSAPRAMGERVQQVDIAFASPVIAATREPAPMVKRKAPPRTHEAMVTVPELPELPSSVDLPLIDTESMIETPLQLSAGTAVRDVQEAVGTLRLGSSDGSALATTVDGSADSSAVQFPENPKPTYPADMLRQSVEAQFVVYFMIDSTGRVDASTIEVPPSVRSSFAVAVREALCQWHFYPAHKQGRPVRQFVGQEFMFRIVRPRQWDGTSAA